MVRSFTFDPTRLHPQFLIDPAFLCFWAVLNESASTDAAPGAAPRLTASRRLKPFARRTHPRTHPPSGDVAMPVRLLLSVLLSACAVVPAVAADDPADVEVMIVGTYHMANPGRDLHNTRSDDVLAPKRQEELVGIAASLARFAPTVVAVEWPADTTRERYRAYRDGTLGESRNEVVQLGFRLAKAAGLDEVHGIDVDGDFPYGPVQAFAGAHGQGAVLADAHAGIGASVAALQARIDGGSIAQALRWLNEPRRIADDNAFYRQLLRIGAGDEQPGVDLLAAWYRRNFAICANLLQRAKPGDRAVVFYGSGHAFLLRQCVEETPGLRLVEANDHLP